MARPRLSVDAAQVEKLAALHCTMEEIGQIVGCSVDTLSRRFADAIEKGRAHGRASLKRRQYELAMAGNATMLIWLGKQHLGQKDRQEIATPEGQEHVIRVIREDRPLRRDDG